MQHIPVDFMSTDTAKVNIETLLGKSNMLEKPKRIIIKFMLMYLNL